MRVATRLRLTLAFLAAVIATVVIVHVVSMRRTVDGTRSLSAIASRQRVADAQRDRLEDISASLRKFAVTGDRAYVERVATAMRAHEGEIRALELQSSSPGEAGAVRDLSMRWRPVSEAIDSLVIEARLGVDSRVRGPAPGASAARRVAATVDSLRTPTEHFASATRLAMLDELRSADQRAGAIGQLFRIVAIAAVFLAGILSTLLVRSIIDPLERLAQATRDVARGHFGARVNPAGGHDDELATLTRDFNEMSARLEQLDRMKRDFISNVSHDLKSPLAAMQETNDVLLDGLGGPLSERQRRLLEMSRDGGRRLASMIHKLLDLSRLDSRPTPVRELLDLSALAQRAVDHVNASRYARGRGPSAVFELSPVHVLLRADAEEMAQVLENLLENAVKFSPEKGTVRVGLDELDGAAVLHVSDEGPGVPDQDRHRVFERFYQGDAGRNATPADRGVGLGLAICRHVVDAHGGSITVRDNAPRGAVFELILPGAITVPAPDLAPLAETPA